MPSRQSTRLRTIYAHTFISFPQRITSRRRSMGNLSSGSAEPYPNESTASLIAVNCPQAGCKHADLVSLLLSKIPVARRRGDGERATDRRDGRLRAPARVQRHRGHDPALGTVQASYPVHQQAHPRRQERVRRRHQGGQGQRSDNFSIRASTLS